MPLGTVILVTYNSAGSIEKCLAALHAQEGWERIVVDNASRDGSLDRARAGDPGARLLANDANLGFAAAANRGAKIAGGGILLFLNPDTVAEPGALDELARALQTSHAGAVGGALLDANGQIQRGFAVRRFPTVVFMAAEILLLNRIWPGNPVNRRYRCLDLDCTKPQEVDQPAGACLAVKREAFAGIGGFDESFFPVWFEDVDLCRRLRNKGWKIMYEPRARFAHSGGHSVNRQSFRDRQVFWYRSMLRYFRKHAGNGSVVLLRIAIAKGMALRILAVLLGFGPRDAKVSEAVGAYLDVIKQCVLRGPGAAIAREPSQ
jgi:N-acetylglucosaminyl-diphospho-decaprenol L-rhamnosyltransferase